MRFVWKIISELDLISLLSTSYTRTDGLCWS